MTDLRLALIQSSLAWEHPEENLHQFHQKVMQTSEADLIVLPEMFSTGFSMNPQLLATEEHQQKCLSAMQEWSREKNAAITASMMYVDKGKYKNRLVWVEPGGRILFYDKRHLFSMGREPEHYTAGTQRLIIEFRSWKIMPLICYDLRFPFWCRNAWQGDAALFDLQIFIANWPAVRSSAWKKLLPTRAIENVAYVAGLNRVGEDGHGMAHSGDSMVIDYMGEIISAARPFEEEIMKAQLSKEALFAFREKFPVLKDASAPIREV